jgi:hypothetical protein
MAALQAAHDLSRVIIESGVYYVTHVYNAIKVYIQVKPGICGEYPLSAASAKAGCCPESATSGRFLPINAVFPTNGRFYSTGDINSRTCQAYHVLVGTHDVETIMSIEGKNPDEDSVTPTGPETDVEPKDASQAGRGQGIEILSLKIADELDAGGDPYNRTGSFCIIKDRDED